MKGFLVATTTCWAGQHGVRLSLRAVCAAGWQPSDSSRNERVCLTRPETPRDVRTMLPLWVVLCLISFLSLVSSRVTDNSALQFGQILQLECLDRDEDGEVSTYTSKSAQ